METKISVLVAEPSEEYRAAYARAIARETDMELVAQTDNGLRAEALVDEFQPDVVVLDLVLASVDGMSLLARLQAKEKPPRVIVTSAIYNDEVLMECADLGTMYFMQKPVDPPLLVYRIRQTARPRRRTGSLCAQLDAPEPAPTLERRHRCHPRDRRPGAHQGLPVPARGDHAGHRRYGRHQFRDQGALPRGRAQIQHHALAR